VKLRCSTSAKSRIRLTTQQTTQPPPTRRQRARPAHHDLRRRLESTTDFPTPTLSLALPSCATQYCSEYLAAGAACATPSNRPSGVNDCYCSRLTWPTACRGSPACVADSDLSTVASWYWQLCPSQMDSRLGQFAVGPASVTARVDMWAVQTPRAGTWTGYDCYYGLKGGCAKGTTATATLSGSAPKETGGDEKPHRSGGAVAGVVMGSIFLVLALVLITLCFRKKWKEKKARRRVRPPRYSRGGPIIEGSGEARGGLPVEPPPPSYEQTYPDLQLGGEKRPGWRTRTRELLGIR
jgi:hypothetical protein